MLNCRGEISRRASEIDGGGLRWAPGVSPALFRLRQPTRSPFKPPPLPLPPLPWGQRGGNTFRLPLQNERSRTVDQPAAAPDSSVPPAGRFGNISLYVHWILMESQLSEGAGGVGGGAGRTFLKLTFQFQLIYAAHHRRTCETAPSRRCSGNYGNAASARD